MPRSLPSAPAPFTPSGLPAALLAVALSLSATVGLRNARADEPPAPPEKPEKPSKPKTEPAPAAAAGGPLIEAQLKAQRGDLDAAEAIYRKLSGDPKTRADGVAGLGEIYLMTGRHDEARLLLEPAAAEFPRHSAVLTRLAEFCETVGRYGEARDLLVRAKAADPDNLRARQLLGVMQATLGNRDAAIEEWKWFERYSKREHDPKTPLDMVTVGDALDALAVETGRRSYYSKFILNELYAKAEQADKNCWQSRLAQGRILASRYNTGQAITEFQACLKINPKAADAHSELAALLLDQWRFDDVDRHIGEALKINPRHVGALQARAVMRYMEFRHAEALAAADEALKINPNHQTGLGIAAAAATMVPDPARVGAALAAAKRVNPAPVEAYLTAGQLLDLRYQFDDARQMFAAAQAAAPRNSAVLTSYGLMLLRTGDEEPAYKALTDAFSMDRFNVRVYNSLQLLDKLRKWAADDIVTEHFVIRHDKSQDGPAARQMADYLESVFPELSARFSFKPKAKTLIEIFPEHAQLGVRFGGLPQTHATGICTGDVIGVDSPNMRPGGSPFPFNWAAVIRHEYTHTLTLGATENRIAHWFTEALAKWSEGKPRNWFYQRLLFEQLQADDLFKPQEISWGFIRPRRMDRDDRQLAYAQGAWICEFIDGTPAWGRKALVAMLEGFRLRKTQAVVFKEVLGVDEDEFHKRFCEWARKDVEGWGFKVQPKPRPVDELEKLLKDKPEDVPLLIELSRSHVWGKPKNIKAGLEAARKAAKLAPENPAALDRLARLLSNSPKKEDREEAAAVWDKVFKLDERNWQAAEVIGQTAMEKKDYPRAVAAFERLAKLVPGHPAAYSGLSSAYLLMEQPEKAAAFRRKLVDLEENDRKHAQWLAEYHADKEQWAEAAEAYREVLAVDPHSIDAHMGLADAAMKAEGWTDARRNETAMRHLELALACRRIEAAGRAARNRPPDPAAEAVIWLRLAKAHKRFGRPADARTAAEAALKLDPESGAKEFLDDLK